MFLKFHERRQRGFTLVELIIVLAILAILSALALSRLNYNRARAANRVCNSKMGEIKKAAEAYFLDTGNPPGGTVNAQSSLITGAYLKGVPSNPHIGGGSNYTVSWDDGTEVATVTCTVGSTTVNFPPGHP